MNIIQLALVSQTPRITLGQLLPVVAALQKQITRDFTPFWKKKAIISAFENLNQIPLGYWPIIIRDDINEPGAAGYHDSTNHQPFALVQYSPSWSLTVSHEMLEMLADPYGNKLKVARSIKAGQGKVQYLVEICDPSEDAQFAYDIQGVLVSDFYTPAYFDKLKVAGKRYSFTGAIQEPLQVLPGGYLSWLEPVSDTWWQALFFGQNMVFKALPAMKKLKEGSLRSRIDSLTNSPLLAQGIEDHSILTRAIGNAEAAQTTQSATANYWEQEVEKVMKKYAKK